MTKSLKFLLTFIRKRDGINDKERLATLIYDTFHLTKDRSVYYCTNFAIRFSSSKLDSANFSNTVLSLSNLRKYDDRPFIVCLITPSKNFCFIANSTFLKKVSHSSHELRKNNIRGSFNGSDIVRRFENIENNYENIDRLFAIHSEIGFEGNLPRLVEATNNISPSGTKFEVDDNTRSVILFSPERVIDFIESLDFEILETDLNDKMIKYKNEILIAAHIENVNVRGRIIEYLITGNNKILKRKLVEALNSSREILKLKTDNTLGDYQKTFDSFDVEVDVKTKIIFLNSNPKGFNLDKMLKFLSAERSVFMFYFIGVDNQKNINTVLVSMFQKDLLQATILLRHWSGRNSRGVSQLGGKIINMLIKKPNYKIDKLKAKTFLGEVIAL